MVITGRRNGKAGRRNLKRPRQTWRTLAGFSLKIRKTSKQTGKHRVNDGQAPFRNTVGIGVFSKKHRFF